MSNPGQPTISIGSTDVAAVKRAQRGVRRTPNLDVIPDGVFGPVTRTAIEEFQGANGLTADGVVGPLTWAALPDGAPMPELASGQTGAVVEGLQGVLAHGASAWLTGPGAVDGDFGPQTQGSVEAFQRWGGVAADGVVGDLTWAVSLHAASATLETEVGLNYIVG